MGGGVLAPFSSTVRCSLEKRSSFRRKERNSYQEPALPDRFLTSVLSSKIHLRAMEDSKVRIV